MPDKENNTPATNGSTAVTSAVGTTAASTAATSADVPLNNTRKRTPDEYTKNFDLNEISPLRTSAAASTSSNGSKSDRVDAMAAPQRNGASHTAPVVLNMTGGAGGSGGGTNGDRSADDTFQSGKQRRRFRGTYDELVGKLDLSERARLPFVLVIALCALLLATLIVLVAFWPRIPAYMRAPVCVDKECLDAAAQVSVCSYGSGSAGGRCPFWAGGHLSVMVSGRAVHRRK